MEVDQTSLSRPPSTTFHRPVRHRRRRSTTCVVVALAACLAIILVSFSNCFKYFNCSYSGSAFLSCWRSCHEFATDFFHSSMVSHAPCSWQVRPSR